MLDKKRFWPTLIFIIIVLVMVSFNLDYIQLVVDRVYSILSSTFGWLFILVNLSALLFSFWIIFGKYRNVKLGGKNAQPEYNTFSWIAMMFTTSCSAGLLVFGFIEPIYYISSAVPFHGDAFSVQSYEYSQMYTHFHWGLNAWALYVPASIAIGYMLYNRKKKQATMSIACEPLFKKKTDGVLSCTIDIFSTFGAVVAPVTSMGLGMPLLTSIIQEIFNLPDKYIEPLQIIILIIWILIFGTSVYFGLQKGIKNLSNANVFLAFAFMVFVGLLTGIFKIFQTEINTIGLYIANFIKMSTYTDPFGDGGFVQTWTIWYWAWLIVYMPLMGVFNARISKGRKLKDIALGQMFFCSLGCWIGMMTLGNYSLNLQISGTLDIANILNNYGQAAAVVAIIKTMPFSEFMLIVVAILCFMFMATTVDSSSFVAAETTIKHTHSDNLAPRWIRILWASIACCITFVLLKVGGFNAVQVLAILIGLPLAILLFFVILSCIKMLNSKD